MTTASSLNFHRVPLDTESIPQSRLNIDNKERSNPFPWNGQFSPQLVEQLLEAYANRGTFILDPFLGSGTVLLEAARFGLPAFGSEINPAAFKMADTYRFINLSTTRRRQIVDTVADLLHEVLPDDSPLFATSRPPSERPLHELLANEAAAVTDEFAKVLIEALVVLINVGSRELDQRAIDAVWSKVRENTLSLPFSKFRVELANCDARALPVPAGQVDLVLTSPPYINVFNYHQHYRKSVESLGWDLLEVAKSEIGSNRKHRGNRFLTVIQYCLDMAQVFHELRRVCRPDARIIFVVGRESNVRKTVFYNGEIVAELAVSCAGFSLSSRQERVFQNRFGEMIYEDILHFSPNQLGSSSLVHPRQIAEEALKAALVRVPSESESDLWDAIERTGDVDASPVYRPQGVQNSRHVRQDI
jgi:SAM-dependent methyltransferase